MSSTQSSNLTSGFIDLATFDEVEKFLYGGAAAVTYFIKQVRKSTWFTVVPVVLSRTGVCQFGSTFSVTISRAGDYLLRSWLRVQLPAISITFTPANVPVAAWANDLDFLSIRWTRNIMHNLVKEASITFNDLVEARFDNFFLDFWYQFTVPAGKKNGYNNMIGNFNELTNPLEAPSQSGTDLPSAILNLPLPFAHFRETGLGLPAAALPYNEMRINLAFRNWQELLIIDNSVKQVSCPWPANLLPNNNVAPQLIADVWAEYALVSNMERVQMGKAPRDILIEQVQTAPIQGFNAGNNTYANNLFNLHFAHSVKALFFGVQNVTNSSEWSNYTSASPVPTAQGVNFSPALASDPVANTSLFYENTQRLANMGSDYFSLIQPWYTAISIPTETGYHLYSYTLDLLNTNPMGSTDYGKLTNVSMSFTASVDSQAAAAATGTLSVPGPLASDGAGIAQSYQAIVMALNHNIVRIAGGALGKKGRKCLRGSREKVDALLVVWTPVGINILIQTYILEILQGIIYNYLVIVINTMAKHHIMPGNSLESWIRLTNWKLLVIPRLIASGIVIIPRIGQSAGKVSKSVLQDTTLPQRLAQMLVNNDGLANLSWLKIQSGLLRKLEDLQFVPRFVNVLFCYYYLIYRLTVTTKILIVLINIYPYILYKFLDEN